MKKVLVFVSIVLILLIVIVPVSACQGSVNADVSEDCSGYTVSANPDTVYEDERGQNPNKWYATRWSPTSVNGTGTYPWVSLEDSHTVTVTVTWTKSTRASATDPWITTSETQTASENVTANRPAQCNFTFCHVAGLADDPANYITHEDVPLQQVLGHFNENGTKQAGHEQDYLGACNPPPPPPTYCETTIDGETTWGDWVIAGDGLTRTRDGSIALFDAVEITHPCGSRPVQETQYLYCIDNTTDWYYEGEEPDDATIGLCPVPPDPGSADVVIGACHWVNGKSVKDVTITIDHAMLTITDVGDFDTSQTIQLPSGIYDWFWTAIDPYVGSEEGQLTIEASCKPSNPPETPEEPKLVPVTGGEQPSWLLMLWMSIFN